MLSGHNVVAEKPNENSPALILHDNSEGINAASPSGNKRSNASWNCGRKTTCQKRRDTSSSSSSEEKEEVEASKARRTAALTKEGAKQTRYPKSNMG